MNMQKLATILLCAALSACASPQTPIQGNLAPEGASGFRALSGWQATRFMAATANPLATDAGYQILRTGGSALDAAIAVQMVLCLVEPQSSGIGGGAFLVHFDGKQVQAFDGRETAPAAVGPDLFLQDGKSLAFMTAVVGGRSVGVPGVLRMLEMAHRQHGRLPWVNLFEPAIRLAEEGFTMSPRLALLLRAPDARRLREDPEARDLFFAKDREPLPAGSLLRNIRLAASLRAIASRGSDAFYTGPLAGAMVTAVRTHVGNPGALTEADLAGYRAKEREALCFDYRRWRICGMLRC